MSAHRSAPASDQQTGEKEGWLAPEIKLWPVRPGSMGCPIIERSTAEHNTFGKVAPAGVTKRAMA